MIMGILKPEKGQILIEGTDPQAMDRKPEDRSCR